MSTELFGIVVATGSDTAKLYMSLFERCNGRSLMQASINKFTGDYCFYFSYVCELPLYTMTFYILEILHCMTGTRYDKVLAESNQLRYYLKGKSTGMRRQDITQYQMSGKNPK